MSQVFWVPVLAWIAVLVGTGFDLGRGPRPIGIGLAANRLARWVCLVPLGLMGIWGFLGHVFFPAETAASIGWPESPFQYEIGMANLAIGVTGIVAAVFGRPAFRWALALVALVFLGGDGVGHLMQISATGDMAAGNAGPILYADFLTPAVLVAALALEKVFADHHHHHAE